ncbi:Ureidoglycolate lyase [Pigmentiphaga humi]|uniref:Ureidoglycolate lyase n=1 Tax=Pigmentiphaga humi TaxID=2478468 RepID=A0A3P4B6W1_9BURK|nr:fumarylacetoacetate hydrolase family protein [Pigmentiphaga humi]VCU72029.1 Ureidoglycolate lyase [Pigmentiphaga humi]
MRLCRFNSDRLGLIEDDSVADVSEALGELSAHRWGAFAGDPLILALPRVMDAATRLRASAPRVPLASVELKSPITQPGKIMAAPANYSLHVKETIDPGIDHGVHSKALEGVERPPEKYGLFLKALSALVGAGQGVDLVFPDRRTDHEIELAVIIGVGGHSISASKAMEHVAGYSIGLDMTVRGAEDRSFRKSPDSYCVLGPAIVTRDEIDDPMALELTLSVNGVLKQTSSTSVMTVGIAELIALASRMYTLQPGDVLLTGTPQGVGAVRPGDVMQCSCSGIGEMQVPVRLHGNHASARDPNKAD